VFIPYDGFESAEATLIDMKRAGLPQNIDALVAVTNLWLPASPYEISRAVSARRMKLLNSGMSSFAPALRDYEEQRVLSAEAGRRIRSICPSATIRTDSLQDVAVITGEILRKAKAWGAELIIIGSNTSPSPDITDYAGPALRIARDAHCSVRIARTLDRWVGSPVQIIIAVDESVSDSIARTIQAVALRFWPAGSHARIVAVRKDPSGREMKSEDSRVLERWANALRSIGLKASIAIKYGPPQDLLLQEARDLKADCIFLDARGFETAKTDSRSLSRVAAGLVLGAHCPVEVVRQNSPTNQDTYRPLSSKRV
jgi:nucleotide-binding universal stress UspA family protein